VTFVTFCKRTHHATIPNSKSDETFLFVNAMFDIVRPALERGREARQSDDCSPLVSEISNGRRSMVPENRSHRKSCLVAVKSLVSQLRQGLRRIGDSVSKTLKTRWFWYSIAATLCWTGWAFTAKLGSEEIPPGSMQFVSAFGFLLVALVLVVVQKPPLTSSLRGNCFALVSGLLLGLGGIALYGAYRAGTNASVVTAITSLYPAATVILAVTFLRERLSKVQALGVVFALGSILLFSF
jgi:transporter family protein